MIGTKIYKEYIENPDGGLGFWDYDEELYFKCSCWCNENGNATIEDKGEYYEVVAIPAPSLDELKTAKLKEVDSWTASKITNGFTSTCSGETAKYDSDLDTQITMQGIALNVNTERFSTDYPHGCPVRGYLEGETEKTVQYLNAKGVLKFCADLSEHIGKCKLDGWTMQNAVNEATTKEELDAIILD